MDVRHQLSRYQKPLWLLHKLGAAGTSHGVTFILHLTGRLDAQGLRQACDDLLERHPMLRATFHEDEGEPRYEIAPPGRPDFVVLAAQRPVEEEAASLAAQPFDLARGPIIRFRLLPVSPERHALLVSVHHIVFDGASLDVFCRELIELYAARVAGHPPALPPPPLTYAELVAREAAGDEEAARAYWKERAAATFAPVALPTGATSGSGPAPAAKVPFRIPPPLRADLAALGESCQASMFATLLAGLYALLRRYGNEGAFPVHVAASVRPAEADGVVGYFVNEVALPLDAPRGASFRAILGLVRDQARATLRHRHFPFAEVARLARGSGGGRTRPHVILSYNRTPLVARHVAGLHVETEYVASADAKADLRLILWEREGGLDAAFEHDAVALDRGTVEAMARHMERLLAAAVADPDRPLEDLPLLAPEERVRMLEAWNATSVPVPPDLLAHHLVEMQAARSPDAVAVSSGGLVTTYAELDARAAALARRLHAEGVRPGVFVGLLAERSVDVVVGALAILKAGGAYVPLDPSYPEDRLAFMLKDADAPVLLASDSLTSRLPHPRVVPIGDAPAPPGDAAPVQAPAPSDPAYVIYTSGSTGVPKGVVVTHANLVRSTLARRAHYVDVPRRFLWVSPVAFDSSVAGLFWTLAEGGALLVAPTDDIKDPARIADALAREEATHVLCTPSLYALTLERLRAPLPALRVVIVAGESLTSVLAQRHHATMPHVELHNEYGPTEATVWCAVERVRRDESLPIVPIGRPVANARLYVLDSRRRPLPPGVAGELWVGGDGVAKGYLRRPDLTAERFVADPFSPPGRMYRTGDRARRLPDGRIEFLGRVDHQVKVRGVRIEPGEVEAALVRCRGVKDAVVVAREDAPGDARLVAYVVADDGAADARSLRAQLLRTLPEPFVPSAFVAMDALPLNPNGKVDRAALPPPPRDDARRAGTAPRTAAERVLADVWRSVLSVGDVHAEDDFFERGGHSLLATKVAWLASEAFGVEIPLRAVFEHPTLEGLARAVDALRQRPAAPRAVTVERDSPGSPLSFAQARLWFIHQWAPRSAAYHVPVATRLRGPLDAHALEQALAEVVRRHEPLRSVYPATDGEPVQLAVDAPVRIVVTDLARVPSHRRETAWRSAAEEEVQRPFDLARGPVLRAHLYRLETEDHLLLLTCHHIAFDGASVGVLLQELAEAYASRVEARPAALPPLPVGYGEHARRQRDAAAVNLDAHLAYWTKRLHGLAPLELPTDRPRPAVPSGRAGRVPVALSADTLRRIQEVSRRESVTPFMTLLAAFQSVLHRWTGQDDVVVGSPVSGRTLPETERLVGVFVNLLVLRTSFAGEPTFRDVLRRVRETCLGAYAHQDVPFERLVEALQPGREAGRTPFFTVAFTHQGPAPAPLAAADLVLEPVPLPAGGAKFDLSLSVADGPDGLRGQLEYATDLFDAGSALRLVAHLDRLLHDALQRPDAPVSRLRLLADDEERLLSAWSRRSVAYPRDACIHHLVEEEVRRAPDRVALTFEGASLTYGELNARANRLAHRLRKLGVGPDVLVGLCAERSFDLVVGMLGILKAGGAYVPLDPAYPRERLAFMLEDTRAPLVLAQARLADRLPPDARTLLLDREDLRDELEHDPEGDATADGLAYVMYTSGSTGRPKGVETPHRGVVRLVRGTDYVDWSRDDVYLHMAPPAFDAATFEVWGALLSGARLVLLPPGTPSTADVARALREHGVTVAWMTAPLFHLMVDEHLDALRGLRHLLAGGDVLSPARVARAVRAGCSVVNGYGPTEATTFTCCHPVSPEHPEDEPVPIGRPLANTRVLVLDARLQRVPIGAPGELFVGGDGLARGYLRRPDLTRERFVDVDGERLYRTGDRVRWRPDGALEFLGRLDQQVKIRGFRVEPGEVEAALAGVPGVREAAVVARPDPSGEKRLVAYVALHEGAAAAEVRDLLRRKLPEPLVPSLFVTLPRLPHGATGKVDRHALPEPSADGARVERSPPRTETERALCALWAELLGVPEPGAMDDFFHLGGHSLAATQLVSRIRLRLGADVPLRTVFEHPTLEALARAVDDAPRAHATGIRPAPRKHHRPMQGRRDA